MEKGATSQSAQRGNEGVLLVEGDSLVRVAVRHVLLNLGYRVLEAGTGAEALKIWEQHPAGISLALIDLVIPGGMSGRALGEQLSKQSPKLKVIYCSGYTSEIAGEDFPLQEGVNFLTKPFTPQKLAQAIRAVQKQS